MNQEIYKNDGKLVIKIPLIKQRSNPYDENYHEDMPNIIGLIEDENDMGFCYRIDMNYKGKDDQWTDYFFKWFGTKEEFEKLCKELQMDIIYNSKYIKKMESKHTYHSSRNKHDTSA